MAVSPTCTVNGGSTSGGVDVAAASAVTIALTDTSARTWLPEVIGVDDSQGSYPTLTINHVNRTATFTAPAAGTATIIRSTVTDAQGTSTATTFAVYVLTTGGDRVVALNETTEGSAAGWVSQLNASIRAIGTVAIGGGTAPNYWYTTTSRATLVNQTSANDLFTLGSLASNALYSVEARVLIQRAATGGVCGYYKLWLATKTDGGVATDLSAAASERALNSGTSGMLTLATTAGVIKLQFNPNDGANTFYVLSIVTVEVNTNGA